MDQISLLKKKKNKVILGPIKEYEADIGKKGKLYKSKWKTPTYFSPVLNEAKQTVGVGKMNIEDQSKPKVIDSY
jgi:hypothetical protein